MGKVEDTVNRDEMKGGSRVVSVNLPASSSFSSQSPFFAHLERNIPIIHEGNRDKDILGYRFNELIISRKITHFNHLHPSSLLS